MSGKSCALIFVFVAIVASAVAGGIRGLKDSASVGLDGRHIAAVGHKGKPPLIEDHGLPFKHTAKLSGPLTSMIEVVGQAPAVDEVFVLRGTVTSSDEAGHARYKWILPAGVEHINGSLEGVVAVNNSKDFTTEITLRQVSVRNAQVHFQAVGAVGLEQFGNTAQYNTLLEGAINAAKEDLQKSTIEDALKHQPKVIH